MANDDESPTDGAECAMAAGASAENMWARQGRQAILESHSLNVPLARWLPEPVEPAMQPSTGASESESGPPVVIPEQVIHPRAPHRLPEDSVCRSPIAGLVIAVMAATGQEVRRHQPVLIIEAMKMLNHVSPQVDGVVRAMRVAPGDAVKAGQVLFELA